MEYYNYDCPTTWSNTECPNMCCWQTYERGIATIRKLVLHMSYKSRNLNTCQACATSVVCPMLAVIDKLSHEQEEEHLNQIMLRYHDTKAAAMELVP